VTARSRIVVMPRARDEILRIDAWWQKERALAPDTFSRELRAAMALLRVLPNCGRVCDALGFEGVRRLLLRRTRYYLYYRFDTRRKTIIILAIRHTSRGPTEDAAT
jgi:plasmid stabilization system protein ParE